MRLVLVAVAVVLAAASVPEEVRAQASIQQQQFMICDESCHRLYCWDGPCGYGCALTIGDGEGNGCWATTSSCGFANQDGCLAMFVVPQDNPTLLAMVRSCEQAL